MVLDTHRGGDVGREKQAKTLGRALDHMVGSGPRVEEEPAAETL